MEIYNVFVNSRFSFFFVIILFRMIAPENVNNRYTSVVILVSDFFYILLVFNSLCEMLVLSQQRFFVNSLDMFIRI